MGNRGPRKGEKEMPDFQHLTPYAAGIDVGREVILLQFLKTLTRSLYESFPVLPGIFTVWRTGFIPAVSRQWLWNPRASTGYRCLRFWSVVVLKSNWSMPIMSRMFPAGRRTFRTANGCSGFIPTVFWKVRSGPRIRYVCCVPT